MDFYIREFRKFILNRLINITPGKNNNISAYILIQLVFYGCAVYIEGLPDDFDFFYGKI